MRTHLLLTVALAAVSLTACHTAKYGRAGLATAPKVVNVSSYDPKEKQRGGDSYSVHDLSALKRNGTVGFIARCGKGRLLDEKCADFLSAADRQGMLLGTYYFVLKDVDPVWQADQYIRRLRQIAADRGLRDRKILLVGDFDTKSTPDDLIAFNRRVVSLTGVQPVVYLENSAALRRSLSRASPAQKAEIRRSPYWLALYSHTSGFHTPHDLLEAYDIWRDWAMWQYGGVEWRHGRSQPLVYHHGPWRAPRYFGTMDRPLEHNAFNGNIAGLNAFWDRHSWRPN
jgi:GH25 family lysozyme M1 (1,4-beta-N-acetylmuramidase)